MSRLRIKKIRLYCNEEKTDRGFLKLHNALIMHSVLGFDAGTNELIP